MLPSTPSAIVPDYERDGYEYYMLNQVNCSPSWYSISLRYHQTTLYDTLGIAH